MDGLALGFNDAMSYTSAIPPASGSVVNYSAEALSINTSAWFVAKENPLMGTKATAALKYQDRYESMI